MRALAADVTDAAAVRHALEGVEVAFYLVHSLGSPDYAALDRRAAATVAREAERAGVSQLVYLGGLGDDRPTFAAPPEQARDGRRALVRLRPGTTLRAAVVVGQGSAASRPSSRSSTGCRR